MRGRWKAITWLYIVLLLSSCESAKFRPWASYSEYGGTSLGINENANRFINNALGDSWTVGFGFEFPLGSAGTQRVRFEWPDFPPRYSLRTDAHTSTPQSNRAIPIGTPQLRDQGPPAPGIEDTLKDVVEGGNLMLYLIALGALLMVVAVLARLGLLRKNGGKTNE